MGGRGGGQIDMHPVLHRLGFRAGDEVDAHGRRVGVGETHGFEVGHAGPLAVDTPTEGFRPESAERGVVLGLHVDLHQSRCHAQIPSFQCRAAYDTNSVHVEGATVRRGPSSLLRVPDVDGGGGGGPVQAHFDARVTVRAVAVAALEPVQAHLHAGVALRTVAVAALEPADHVSPSRCSMRGQRLPWRERLCPDGAVPQLKDAELLRVGGGTAVERPRRSAPPPFRLRTSAPRSCR